LRRVPVDVDQHLEEVHFGEIARPIGAPIAEKITAEQTDERALKCEPLTIREFLAYLYRTELHQEHDGPKACDAAELLQVPHPPRAGQR